MEDWQEMAIIVIVVLLAMIAYFVYLGYQFAGLQSSIASYANMQQALGGSQGSGPETSPINIIINSFGR